MTWQQFLTEKVLKECWHISESGVNNVVGTEPYCVAKCVVCGKILSTSYEDLLRNRTFDNRNDMMDLYEALYREMKWFGFRLSLLTCDDSHAFCLSGEGYEQRCKMVAEFYGWEEGK